MRNVLRKWAKNEIQNIGNLFSVLKMGFLFWRLLPSHISWVVIWRNGIAEKDKSSGHLGL